MCDSWMDINSRVNMHDETYLKRVAQTYQILSFLFLRTIANKIQDGFVPFRMRDRVHYMDCN